LRPTIANTFTFCLRPISVASCVEFVICRVSADVCHVIVIRPTASCTVCQNRARKFLRQLVVPLLHFVARRRSCGVMIQAGVSQHPKGATTLAAYVVVRTGRALGSASVWRVGCEGSSAEVVGQTSECSQGIMSVRALIYLR
jgi:hypothetical protein